MTRGCGGHFSGCRPPWAPRGAPARPPAAPSREPAFTFAADRRVCSGPARADERRPARSSRGAGGGSAGAGCAAQGGQGARAAPGPPHRQSAGIARAAGGTAVSLGLGGASPARAPGLRGMKEPGPSWAKEAEGPWGCCLSVCPPGSGRDPGPGPCCGAASPSAPTPLVGALALSLSPYFSRLLTHCLK